MKKLLALILALVMVMGLATVGTNAALVAYNDADDFNFDEAIDVMSAIGVLEGFEGQFRPTAGLLRSEAAKIVAYLNTNNRTAESLIGVGKFSDVPSNHWAAGYIDYLSSVGILAGRSETSFDPDGALTAIDFAKMLLVVLGYDPQIEGLVGNDYQINTSKLAADEGTNLFKGLKDLKPNDALTREQAAQMAFNAVKAATVQYSNKGGSVSVNGADITFGASGFSYVTTTVAREQYIDDRKLTNAGGDAADSGYTVEFGERQYPDLRRIKTFDDFGRPVNEWHWGKDEVGQYIDPDTVLGSYTTAVTGADLVDLMGEAKIKNTAPADIRYFVNGLEFDYIEPNDVKWSWGAADNDLWFASFAIAKDNLIRGNKVAYAFTGNGVLTEVFERDEQFIITSTFTYYVRAAGDFNEKTGIVAYALYTADPEKDITADSGAIGDVAPRFDGVFEDNGKLSVEDYPEIATLKDKDGFLVRFFWNDNRRWEVGEIVTLDPEIKAEQNVTKYSTSGVNIDGVATGINFRNATDNWRGVGQSGAANRGTAEFFGGYVIAGSQYDYARSVYLDPLLRGYDEENKGLHVTYDLVFDPYGYVIAAFQNNVEDHYLFLAGLNTNDNNTAAGTASGFAIFGDGTSANIMVDLRTTNGKIADYRLGTTTKSAYVQGRDVTYELLNKDTGHAYNRWFSYSTSGEGSSAVYTLTPVSNSLIASTNSWDQTVNPNPNAEGVNSAKRLRISAAQTRLVGDYYTNMLDIDRTVYSRVNDISAWFDEHSTIITVETGPTQAVRKNTLRPQGGSAADAYDRGIAEVTGIYTGIQGTDILAYPQQNIRDGKEDVLRQLNPFGSAVWVIYNKNRFITHAIVVGEDAGGSDSYLYATTGARSESRNGEYYYWDFNAILDGEETSLTVKTKYVDLIRAYQNMIGAFGTGAYNRTQYGNSLFKAKFDKDGYVTSLIPVSFWASSDIDGGNVYSNVYNNSDKAGETDIQSTDVVYNTYTNAGYDELWVRTGGRTLYNNYAANNGAVPSPNLTGTYTSGSDIGITLAPGAPIFVIQRYAETNTGALSTRVDTATSLEAALGLLANPVNGEQAAKRTKVQFAGFVAAGLNKNATAKWLVIKSFTEVNNTNSKTPTGGTVTAKLAVEPQINRPGMLVAYRNTKDINTGKTLGNSDYFVGTDFRYEIWAGQPGVDNSKYTLWKSGTIPNPSGTAGTFDTSHKKFCFSFGGAGADIVVSLPNTMTYIIVISSSSGTWTSDPVAPFGS